MARSWRRYAVLLVGLLCLLPAAAEAEPAVMPAATCSGQTTWGFETLSTSWSSGAGVRTNSPGEQPHSGSWYAWLDGYGTTHTDTLSNTISIPFGCQGTLTFWLHIDTAETTTTTAYDKLTLKTNTVTLATWSNLNHITGYGLHSFSLPAGSVSLVFTGTEDSSLQTSFVIDDITLTVS
jgi:hypothetical protein